MLFNNHRMMKRLGKHLVKRSVLFSAPVLMAGACGLIGLAVLVYLKRRADNNSERNFAGFKEAKRPGKDCGSRTGGKRHTKERPEYSEDDFIVIDAEEGDVRDAEADDTVLKKSSIYANRSSSSDKWVASVISKTFHYPDCSSVGRISAANRAQLEGSIESLINKGYKPCSSCIGK